MPCSCAWPAGGTEGLQAERAAGGRRRGGLQARAAGGAKAAGGGRRRVAAIGDADEWGGAADGGRGRADEQAPRNPIGRAGLKFEEAAAHGP